MKRMHSNNVVKIFLISLIVVGVLFGIIYFNLQTDLNKTLVAEKLTNLASVINSGSQNMIIPHLVIVTLLIFLAYSIVGMPVILFYLFYECTSIGFLWAALYGSYKLKGLAFGLIYTVISKLLFIVCLIYISYIALKTTKKLLRILVLKENESLYQLLKSLFLKLGIILGIVLTNDLFLYFIANKILKFFLFLI